MQIIGCERWERISVPLPEIEGCTDFEVLSHNYRSARPVALITPLKNLSDCVAVNLLAPRDAAFWAALDWLVIFRFERVLLDHLAPKNVTKKRRFLRDLRSVNVSNRSPAIRLFHMFANSFNLYGRAIPGFSSDAIATPETGRMVSLGVPLDLLEPAFDYLDRELLQLRRFAFLAVDGAITLNDPVLSYKRGVGAALFGRFAPLKRYGEEWMRDQLDSIHAALKWAIDRVERTGKLDIPMDAQSLLRPCPSFFLATSAHGPYNEDKDPIYREIISLRARLIRLLGWPIFFPDVDRALREEEARLNSYAITEPYDVLQELKAYRESALAAYPVLGERPFE